MFLIIEHGVGGYEFNLRDFEYEKNFTRPTTLRSFGPAWMLVTRLLLFLSLQSTGISIPRLSGSQSAGMGPLVMPAIGFRPFVP
jgi:hypothetical protein